LGDPAPLISIPDAPAPEGAHAEWFEGAGGVRLRAALFPIEGPSRGSVVLNPGRTEPIEKYFEVARDLAGRGFWVLIHDWRGQGLSQRLLPDPMKGYVGSLDDYLADYRALLDRFEARLPRPWIALGHSMGGALALMSLARGEGRIAGAVLSTPMIRVKAGAAPLWLAKAVCRLMLLLGRRADYAHGTYDPLADRFDEEVLTHDRTRYLRYKAQLNACPALALGATTWAWIAFAFEIEAALAEPGLLEPLKTPVVLVAAGQDRLVQNHAMQTVANRLPHGRYVEIASAYHEILMETDDRLDQFWAAFDALADQVSPPPA
jgi:lysophospholipase